jgi:hypothetical protein
MQRFEPVSHRLKEHETGKSGLVEQPFGFVLVGFAQWQGDAKWREPPVDGHVACVCHSVQKAQSSVSTSQVFVSVCCTQYPPPKTRANTMHMFRHSETERARAKVFGFVLGPHASETEEKYGPIVGAQTPVRNIFAEVPFFRYGTRFPTGDPLFYS